MRTPARAKWLRARRVVGRVAGIALGALMGLVLFVLFAATVGLELAPVRERARVLVVDLAGEALGAPLEIDAIERMSPFRVRVRGVRLLGPNGWPVASVGRATVYLDPFALIAMRVHVPSATLERVQVDLGDLDREEGARGGLLDVLAAIPKDDAAPEPQESGGIQLVLNDLQVVHSRVRAIAGGKALRLLELNGELDVHAGDALALDVHALRAHIERDGYAAAYLDSLRASYRDDAPITAELKAIAGATQLDAALELGPAAQDGAWPLQARTMLRALDASTLAALGLDPSLLRAPIDLDVEATGSTYDVAYAALLSTPGGDARLEGTARPLGPEGVPRRAVDALLVTEDLQLAKFLNAEAEPISGELRAHLDSEDAFESLRGTFGLARARYASGALPEVQADARYASGVGLRVEQLLATYPSGSQLKAQGAYSEDGALTAQASFETSELRDIPVLRAQLPELCGALSADVAFARDPKGALAISGELGAAGVLFPPFSSELLRASLQASGKDFDALRLDAKVTATRGRVEKERFQRLEVVARGSEARGFELSAHLDQRARAQAKLRYLRDKLEVRDLYAAYAGAELRADLDYDPRRTSRVKAKLDAPDLERLTRRFMETPLRGALHIGVNGALERDEVALELSATDAKGPFLKTQLRAALKRKLAATRDGITDLMANAWQADIALKARRVRDLPLVSSLDLPSAVLPAMVALDLSLAHAPRQEPRGHAQLSAYWPGPTRDELKSAPVRCGRRGEPRFDVEVKMQHGELEARARAQLDGKQVATISTKASAPLDEWLTPKSPRPVMIATRLTRLPLEDLPVVCERVAGEVSGSARLLRALTDEIAIDLNLSGDAIRFGKAPAFDAVVAGHADQNAVALSGRIDCAGGHADLRARIPLDVGGRAPTIDVRAPSDVSLRVRQMGVAALLAPVDALSARSGTLDAELRMDAPLIEPSVFGRLHLKDVSLVLRELGQPFERVNGELVLEGRHMRLLETVMHDVDGIARISGTLDWQSLETWSAQLNASADDLPIRRQGVILARLDGRLAVRAGFSPRRRHADVQLSRAVIELTDADFSGIQSLEENPEIVFVDAPKTQVEKDLDSAPSPPIEVLFDASQPFWVRRSDFSVLVSTKLKITLRDADPGVSGTIELQRGVVELVGTMFDIKSGQIQLVGGHGVEPVLQLRAERRAPGGDVVAIEANGPLRQPKLQFFVNDEAVTAGEALAAASGSRREGGEASVQDQLGGMATGILAGVLTLGARRELGELVPVLGVETGENSTSLRAGIGARRLVPKFLRDVVTDAYIEGILTQNEEAQPGEESTTSQTQASVLLELRFPHDLVGEAQYEPGQRWSLDLSWEP